jgi:hypothetical protein
LGNGAARDGGGGVKDVIREVNSTEYYVSKQRWQQHPEQGRGQQKESSSVGDPDAFFEEVAKERNWKLRSDLGTVPLSHQVFSRVQRARVAVLKLVVTGMQKVLDPLSRRRNGLCLCLCVALEMAT